MRKKFTETLDPTICVRIVIKFVRRHPCHYQYYQSFHALFSLFLSFSFPLPILLIFYTSLYYNTNTNSNANANANANASLSLKPQTSRPSKGYISPGITRTMSNMSFHRLDQSRSYTFYTSYTSYLRDGVRYIKNSNMLTC